MKLKSLCLKLAALANAVLLIGGCVSYRGGWLRPTSTEALTSSEGGKASAAGFTVMSGTKSPRFQPVVAGFDPTAIPEPVAAEAPQSMSLLLMAGPKSAAAIPASELPVVESPSILKPPSP